MRVKLQLVLCSDEGQEETITDVASITSSATFVHSRITRHAQTTSRLQSESYLTMLSHHASL
jgi:hypothetical protein